MKSNDLEVTMDERTFSKPKLAYTQPKNNKNLEKLNLISFCSPTIACGEVLNIMILSLPATRQLLQGTLEKLKLVLFLVNT